jgi:hypothetical protein
MTKNDDAPLETLVLIGDENSDPVQLMRDNALKGFKEIYDDAYYMYACTHHPGASLAADLGCPPQYSLDNIAGAFTAFVCTNFSNTGLAQQYGCPESTSEA